MKGLHLLALTFPLLLLLLFCVDVDGYYDPSTHTFVIDDNVYNNEWTDEYDAETLIVSEGVSTICDNAFENFSSLISIQLPSTLTSIGNNAFSGCSNVSLLSISFNECSIGSNAFNELGVSAPGVYVIFEEGVSLITDNLFFCDDGTYIVSVEFIDEITYIGNKAFWKCFAPITIPNSVTHIGELAFFQSENIEKIILPKCLTYIGEDAFYMCSNISEIEFLSLECYCPAGSGAFRGVASDLLFTIGDEVKRIPEYLFSMEYTEGISSLIIPSSVEEIGDGAFFQYFGSEIEFEDVNSIKTIGEKAFMRSNITSFTIGNKVESIGNNAFTECCKLLEIIIDVNSYTSYGNIPFYEAGCEGTSVTIIGEIIPSYLFYGFRNLFSVSFDGVSKLMEHSFHGCLSLKEIDLTNINEIKEYALCDIGLNNIMLPAGICLQSYAITSIESLESIVIEGSMTQYSDNSITSIPMLSSITVLSDPGEVMFSLIFDNISSDVFVKYCHSIIHAHMFQNCSWIVGYESLATKIGAYAFTNTGIVSLELNHHVKQIGVDAFSSIDSLKTVYWKCINLFDVPLFRYSGNTESVLVIDSLVIGNNTFRECNFSKLEIRSYPTLIGNGSFSYSKFVSVDLSNISVIPDRMFYSCNNLKNVIFSLNLYRIGGEAFAFTSLESLIFPPYLSYVGDYSFYECNKLEEVSFTSFDITVGKEAFASSGLKRLALQSVSYAGENCFPSCLVSLSGEAPDSAFSEGTVFVTSNTTSYNLLGKIVVLFNEYPNEYLEYEGFLGWSDNTVQEAIWSDVPETYVKDYAKEIAEVSAAIIMVVATLCYLVSIRN